MTGFFDLPLELREMIYDYCLVSTQMIALSNLYTSAQHRPAELSLGLRPNILATNRTISAEATKFLYSHNTFLVDILSSWTCMGFPGASRFRNRRICITCSRKSIHEQSLAQTGYVIRRDHRPSPLHWSPSVQLVRRVYVSLRSYSFAQWRDFQCQTRSMVVGCEPTSRCQHQFCYAIPSSLRPDLLILSIVKPAVVNSEELNLRMNLNYYCMHFTLSDRTPAWRMQAKRDMKRELSWLLAFARRSKNVVFIESQSSLKLDAEGKSMLDGRARDLRGTQLSTVGSKIPLECRWYGQLAKPDYETAQALAYRQWQMMRRVDNMEDPAIHDYIQSMPRQLGQGMTLLGMGGGSLFHGAL